MVRLITSTRLQNTQKFRLCLAYGLLGFALASPLAVAQESAWPVVPAAEVEQSVNSVPTFSDEKIESSKETISDGSNKKYSVVEQQRGLVSWYGPGFHGRKTASGERFDMLAATAAHRKWPLGSLVRVTNERTKRSIIVRINDRGPYHGKRILDVSKAVATQLGFIHQGSAALLLERLKVKAGDEASTIEIAAQQPTSTPITDQLGDVASANNAVPTRKIDTPQYACEAGATDCR